MTKVKNTNRPQVSAHVVQAARDAASDNALAIRVGFASSAENNFSKLQLFAAVLKENDAIEVTQATISKAFKALGYKGTDCPEPGKNDPKRVKPFFRAIGHPDCAAVLATLKSNTLDAVAGKWDIMERQQQEDADPKKDAARIDAQSVVDAVKKALIDKIKSGKADKGDAYRMGATDFRVAKDLGVSQANKNVDPATPIVTPDADQNPKDKAPTPDANQGPDANPTPNNKSEEQDTAQSKYTEERDKLASMTIAILDALDGPASKTKGGVALPIKAGGRADTAITLINRARAARIKAQG